MRTPALLVLVAISAPAALPAAAQDAQTVSVQMSDFKFSPNAITLQAGKTYRLHFDNTASHGHSFSAPDFFAAASVRAEDQAKLAKGTIEVPGGQSVDVQFVAPRAGQYRFHCSHFLHSSFGMTGAITVQ